MARCPQAKEMLLMAEEAVGDRKLEGRLTLRQLRRYFSSSLRDYDSSPRAFGSFGGTPRQRQHTDEWGNRVNPLGALVPWKSSSSTSTPRASGRRRGGADDSVSL